MDPRLAVHSTPVEYRPLDYRHYTYDICRLGECLPADEVCIDYPLLTAMTLACSLNGGILSPGLAEALPVFASASKHLEANYMNAHDVIALRRRLTGNKIVH